MKIRNVSCTRCTQPFPAAFCNTGGFQQCPSCLSAIQIQVFPSLFQGLASGSMAEPVVTAEEASCFYHSEQRAAESCGRCGRFLCALCDLEIAGEHLCPTCFEGGRKSGKLAQVQNRRTLYDSLALTLAILPMIIWPVTLLSAPLVLFISIYYWKKPLSIIPRTRARFVWAIIFALLQIGGWCALFIFWLK